jgi:hypothetical protein
MLNAASPRRSFFSSILAWALILPLPACGQTSVAPSPLDSARVLFIGNSLTYFNDLPGMVKALSISAGLHWDVRSVTIGGASLDDHMGEGTAAARLRSERWDVVVLQQGPSTQVEGRANLRQGTARFEPLIEGAGARVALYEVWPDSTWSAARFTADFDRLRDSYALAATDVGGLFLPAGEAWRLAWRDDPSFKLYGPDGFHPSAEGSYLAALTIVRSLSQRSVVGLQSTLKRPDGTILIVVPPGPASRLQKAADQAVARFGDYHPADQP